MLPKGGRFQDLPDHGWNTAKGSDFLPFDECHGPFRVPLIHHHQLVAGCRIGDQCRVTASRMEKRYRQQRRQYGGRGRHSSRTRSQ